MSLEAVVAQTLVKRADGKGRVAVHEIMLGTPAIRNLIREAKVPQMTSMMQMGSKLGMTIMRDSLNRLFESGTISSETLREALMTGASEEDNATPAGGKNPSATNVF